MPARRKAHALGRLDSRGKSLRAGTTLHFR